MSVTEYEARYQDTVMSCAMAAKMVIGFDIPKLLEDIEKAEIMGPMLDPTLYREKGKAMAEDKRILEAALPLWRIGKEMEKRQTEGVKP